MQRPPTTSALLRLAALAALPLLASGQRAGADVIRSAPRYTVTDLGDVPGGVHYTPYALNNRGQAVGQYNTATGGGSFYYSDGVMQAREMAYPAINDAGQSPLNPADRAINNAGHTVGSRDYPWEANHHATLTTPDGTIDIRPVGSINSGAHGINDRGQVVGGFTRGNGVSTPFLYSDGESTDLGSPGPHPGRSLGLDINDLGQIAGNYVWDGGAEGFLYSDGDYRLLGVLPGGSGGSSAQAINEAGQVVGRSSSASGTRAFLYESGFMWDLNDLIPPETSWTLFEAVDINDLGQILVKGSHSTGGNRALVLTPIAVPEPTVLSTLAALGFGLAWRARNRLTHCRSRTTRP